MVYQFTLYFFGGETLSFTDLWRYSDPALLILASLAGGAKHGYAMLEDIKALSGIRLGPGTLYGALARLEERGLIESLPSQERRRPYRLTVAGITLLREQLTSLERFATASLQRVESTRIPKSGAY